MSRSSASARLTSLLLAAAAASLISAAPALASTTTKTVPATVVYAHGQNPDNPGNCSAVVFVQWPDEPHATKWTVYYHYNGVEKSKAVTPPFDDTYKWVATYTVAPGSHWTALSKTWSSGSKPNDCTKYTPKQQAVYGTDAHVVMTIDTTACDAAKAQQSKARKAVARANKAVGKAKTKKARRQAQAKLKKARADQKKANELVATEC